MIPTCAQTPGIPPGESERKRQPSGNLLLEVIKALHFQYLILKSTFVVGKKNLAAQELQEYFHTSKNSQIYFKKERDLKACIKVVQPSAAGSLLLPWV